MPDYFTLCNCDGENFVQIGGVIGLIDPRRIKLRLPAGWTYVEETEAATVFPSEATAEAARDCYCRFPWIKIKPLREIDKDILNLH